MACRVESVVVEARSPPPEAQEDAPVAPEAQEDAPVAPEAQEDAPVAPEALEETSAEGTARHQLRAAVMEQVRLKAAVEELAARQAEDPLPDVLDELTIVMVVVYEVSLACRVGGLRQTVRAIFWLLVSHALVFTALISNLALGISSNWPRCIGNGEPDDCHLGLACVNIAQTNGGYTRPLCNDCYFLSDRFGTPGAPWGHKLAPGPFMHEPNASRFCIEERLLAPEYARVQLTPNDTSTFTFEHCMYARLAADGMSSLDYIVLQLCFVLLALQVAKDAKEQAASAQLRKLCLPWHVPEATRRSLGVFVLTALVGLLEAMFSKGVPALIPYTMLMLVVTGGADSEAIVLNGLAVGFVLELDTILPKSFLSVQEEVAVKEFFAAAATRRRDRVAAPARNAPPAPGAGAAAAPTGAAAAAGAAGAAFASAKALSRSTLRRNSRGEELEVVTESAIKHPGWTALITSVVMFSALNVGFLRVTKHESGVRYFFYRIGLQYGLWWLLFARTVTELAMLIPKEVQRHTRRRRAGTRNAKRSSISSQLARSASRLQSREVRAALQRRLLSIFYRRVLGPFCETLVVATILGAVYWFASLIYYRYPVFEAARRYLGPFLDDPFGTCASPC